MSYYVQKVVIPKRIMTKTNATKWIKQHNYNTDYDIDIKKNVYRYRQAMPNLFIKTSYRVKTLYNGVELVLAKLKII